MKKLSSWKNKPLMLSAVEELELMGQNLLIARKRRKLTVAALASRLEVDRRVIDKIERGDPTVAVGALMQVLSFFGLIRGISQLMAPEHDIEETILEARRLRKASRPKRRKVFSEDEVDF